MELVSVLGSGNSHVAILARAMGTDGDGPVRSAVFQGRRHPDDRFDGYDGEVYTNPVRAAQAVPPTWSKKGSNWRWGWMHCATCRG